MNKIRMSAAGLCLAFVMTTQAFGQATLKPGTATAPPSTAAPAPVPAPDRTTASFGDWVLRCDRRTDVTPPQRFCELGQTIQRQGEAGPQAQIALGRILPSDPIRLTLLLPINVAFEKAPKLTGGGVALDLS